MPVEVKICGISTAETLQAAIDGGADLIGLVFYSKSPRHVSIGEAARLADQARGRVKIVALTVNADRQLLEEIVGRVNPDYIQAHGGELPSRIAEMQEMTGKPVIKAIRVSGPADIEAGNVYKDAAWILYDAKAPETLRDALPGGNGLAFDWSLLGNVRGKFMLSGGLDAGNVAVALRITGAPMVDVSSGVEVMPGRKDPALIRKFIEAAKAAR
jgi:phosphoribosylanthranilate isomerase